MDNRELYWRIVLILAAAALWASLIRLCDQHHERKLKQMTICEVAGGTINSAGECLPGTKKGM